MGVEIGEGFHFECERKRISLDIIVREIFFRRGRKKAKVEIFGKNNENYFEILGLYKKQIGNYPIEIGVNRHRNSNSMDRVDLFMEAPDDYIWKKKDYRNKF